MTTPATIDFAAEDAAALAACEGTVVVFAGPGGTLSPGAAALDRATGGAIARAVAAKGWKAQPQSITRLGWPTGIAAETVLVASLGAAPGPEAARRAGGAIGAALASGPVTIATEGAAEGEAAAALVAEMLFAVILRLYRFDAYRRRDEDEPGPVTRIAALSAAPEALARLSQPFAALAEGICFTRDLVNEPANVLTTDNFAARLAAMHELGLGIEILGEAEMAKLGMRALLGVGQGSESESKLVVMHWRGGGDEAPLALVGKGVVFDTGGISIKPAAGMEEMTMDMGGAGVVAGVMRTLALRRAKANVVGVVGLVENMPDGKAQRPGDIVRSMKGDTIEVINTDAEGRLVLADALWYTQETFKPRAIIDLATLTGAMIVALGNHMAGFFANDDAFAAQFADAAAKSGDAAWRLPLGKAYDKLIKSHLADMKNTGGRAAGSITAAQFLQRFVKAGTPWIHIDIAGVTLASAATDLAPRGATGWGVAALDRMIRDTCEG